jgi:hypothetical protein
MHPRPKLVGFLSLLVPGLGHIYSGDGGRGAAILLATIVVGNLNAIWLSVAAAAPRTFWATTLPRGLHDLFALYGLVFWAWQVVDAVRREKCRVSNRPGT